MTQSVTFAFATNSAVTDFRGTVQASLESRSDITSRYLLLCGAVKSSSNMSMATNFNEVRAEKIFIGYCANAG